MSDIIRNLVSREDRYQLASLEKVQLKIEMETEGDTEELDAELVDLSQGGAKLRTESPLAVEDVLRLEIHADQLNRPISVAGDVCWVMPTNGGRYWVGCSFRPRIPEDVLEELAQSGLLDRRTHRREQITLRTMAQWEMDLNVNEVWVLNYSRGGVCLLAREEGKPGDRVQLEVEDDLGNKLFIRAKAQWQVETEEGFVIGCELADKSSYLALRRFAEAQRKAVPAVASLWRRMLGLGGKGH